VLHRAAMLVCSLRTNETKIGLRDIKLVLFAEVLLSLARERMLGFGNKSDLSF